MQPKSLCPIVVAFAVVFGMSYAIASRPGAVSKPDGDDWLYVDHDLAGTRYSPLKQINRQNLAKLKFAWIYHTHALDTPSDVNHKAAFEAFLGTVRFTGG